MNIYTGTWNIVFHVPVYFFRGPVVEQNRRYSFPVVQAGILALPVDEVLRYTAMRTEPPWIRLRIK